MKDWLYGVRQIQPTTDAAQTLTTEPLTEAERLRHIHHMIACTREEGGAGITPKHGEWKNVEAIFPLHDHDRNKKWLTEFTQKTFLTTDDLDEIKNTVGEKVSVPCRAVVSIRGANLHRLATTTLSFSLTSPS